MTTGSPDPITRPVPPRESSAPPISTFLSENASIIARDGGFTRAGPAPIIARSLRKAVSRLPNPLKNMLAGKARDPMDPRIFHHVPLVAFLAWVGLGADGLSSSAYGPDEAFRALGSHRSLAIVLVAMTAITIAVISIAYSNLIQHFPGGGGG